MYTAAFALAMPVANLTAPFYSLSAALTWGAADFSGGLATKTVNPFRVVVVAHATGLVFMIALALAFGEPMASGRAMLFGAIAGAVGGIGLAAFYKSLAVGTMGINAPLSAVITAIVPLAYSFMTEARPQGIRIAGFVLALVSIWIMAAPRGGIERSQQGLGLAIVAGIGFGGFLLLMKLAGPQGVFWPLASARAASFSLMLILVLLSRAHGRVDARALKFMIVAGILDSGANALYVMAAQRGRLDVAAVLSSMYPASTLILARFVLKERLSRLQACGTIAALVAVGLISW
jgi:drug/metabolite transporter (DMT)-like permease